jgi:hypothetical protein
VSYYGCNELPKWGPFETHYEVTEKKSCGMTADDSKMVGSDDAPKYLEPEDDDGVTY